MEAWYCWLATSKNEACPVGFQQAFRSAAERQERQRVALRRLCDLLENEEIPFVPIKGVDLAYRIYPVSALRLFSDWDIWVQKADLKRFLALLERDGWRCPSDCRGEHHCGMRGKDEFRLEPHFTLPNFGRVSPKELWALTRPSPGGNCERHLVGELNLIMLLQHAFCCHAQWTDPLKLLLDVDFLLKHETVDWQMVSALVRRWHMAHPGLILAAFPEFFRGRYESGRVFSSEQCAALRELLLSSKDLTGLFGELKAVSGNPLSPVWIADRLSRLSRNNLRLKHPKIGRSNVRYLACLAREITHGIGIVCSGYFRPTEGVREQSEQEKLIRSSWRDEIPRGHHRCEAAGKATSQSEKIQ